LNVTLQVSQETVSRTGRAQIVWRKFSRNRGSLVGGITISTVILMALLAPVIAPEDRIEVDLTRAKLPPSIGHMMGTDPLGRDVGAYIIWGTRTSLMVAATAVLLEILIAVGVGAISGYYRGVIDDVLMRITDVVLVLPTLVLLVVMVSMFKVRSLLLIAAAMAIVAWPWMARVVRSEFLSLREQSFVEAARSLGMSDLLIIARHILPNALSSVIVLATIDVAWFILYESTLTFLGFGDPSAISLGALISKGRNYLGTAWWTSTFPGITIFAVTLACNLLGDGLRDAFDVKTRV